MSIAQISSITFYSDSNYVKYNDSDITTDYFNAYSIGQKATCDWVKTDGADSIIVTVSNNSDSTPHLRRVKQICRVAGYEYEDKSHMHTYYRGEQGWKIEYLLTKVKPTFYVVLWCGAPIGESADFSKSARMDKKNKDIFVKDLKNEGITRITVREFKELVE